MSKIPQQGEQYENIENVLNDLEGLSYGKSVMQEPEEKVNKKEECDNKSLINNNFDSTDMLKKSHLTKFIKQFKLENEICYHGMLPRRDICELLKNNGDFIVRISELCVNKNSHTDKEVKRFMLVLSVLHQNNSVHYMIKVSKNKEIYISDMAFKTLGNLISYYVEKQIPITKTGKVKLISPVPRQSWELQHNQIVLKTKCGSGAFGEVWSGTLTTKNDVYEIAAKVLKNRSNINMNSVREFCAEARVMREYSHPNIVRLYGVAVNEDPVMLIMEYANRGSLDAILRKRKLRPNMDERILYCLQAARGIEYLHEKNCLHRDIAARNCLLSDTCLKVSDFGMTIKFRMGEKGVKMNDINMKIPLRWSAPETVFYGKFTFKTDVFSFGILLWEIYGEGKAPYPKYQMKEVINMLHEGKRLQAQSIMPDEIKFIMETMCFPQECSQRANMKEVIVYYIYLIKNFFR
uniref:Tyrosine-protein kinase n=1 Tax=Parastrongyloides trichosuri TaxID=131310 RepID=A0A0N4ZVE9_PARTI